MKTVIIGAGAISNVHLSVCKSLGYNVVAVCDIDYKKAETLKSAFYPGAIIYTDYKQMLYEIKPNIAHVCTPHYLHTQMIIDCLKLGINVLCEKPLCIDLKDISTIVDAEQKSSAILGVCHQNRYNSVNKFVKDFIKDKTVLCGHGQMQWRRTKEYYQKDEWRGKWKTEGGGVLINQALHTLDLMQWFLGMPTSVTAITENLSLKGVIEVEDTAFLTCEGENPFTFFATNCAKEDFPVSISISLKEGLFVVYPKTVLFNGKVIFEEKENKFNGKMCYGNSHFDLIEEFYKCVKERKEFEINGTESAKVIRLILSAYNGENKI